ncbi:Hsp70 family protein [Myxococcota bacterium]|nr:Hsp70 family protein [Myxococcota bacterium]
MGTIVGIDLGTTNSCVAIVKDGRPRVIEDERGYNILPSCIAFKSRGRFVVGHGAKALILTNPSQTVYAVKRLLGRRFSSPEVQEARRHLSYDIVQGENDEVLLRMDDVVITPVEASSIVLKAIREVAERHLGEDVRDAIVTVPAHFNNAQRKAAMEAGELAGLNVLRLLNEPTAAALAYGFKKDIQKKLAIYDLGGGTFDVTVLEVGDGVYEILATGGDSFLGGEDFDYRIVNQLADRFREKHGIDLRQDKLALQRLKDASERAKCELSFVDKTPILIPRIHGALNLEATLTRDQLEEMVADLINKTLKLTARTMQDAGMGVEDLDDIVIVGGQTRMPKIQEALRIFFGKSPSKGVHPEEVVAIGAAVHGYSLEDESQSTLLLDVTPFSLGIDTAGEYFGKIIERNATIPLTAARTFTTVHDDQEAVKIIVRQGESRNARENELLGEFSLSGIRRAPKMDPRIDVTFKIDASGILHVSACDRDTGQQQAISIRNFVDSGRGSESNQVQLAKEISDVQAVADPVPDGAVPGAAAAQGPGMLGRLKGLFGGGRGKGKGKAGAPPAAAADDAAHPPSLTGPGVSDDSLHAVREREPVPGVDEEIAAGLRESLEPYFSGAGDREGDRTTRSDYALTDGNAGLAATDDRFAISPRSSGAAPTAAAPAPVRQDPFGVVARGEGSAAPAARLGDPFGVVARGEAAPPPLAGHDDPFAVSPRGSGGGIDMDILPLDPPPGGPPRARSPELRPGVHTSVPSYRADPFGVAPRTAGPSGSGLGTSLSADLDGGGVEDGSIWASTDAGTDRHSAFLGLSLPAEPRDAWGAGSGAEGFAAPSAPPGASAAAGETASRAAPRKPARLKVRYKRARTFVEEIGDNLARGGTFVKTDKPLEVGRECVFEVQVPGEEEVIEVRGRVVWSSRGVPKLSAGQEQGMGIQYDRADSSGLALLRSAADRLKVVASE